jgi:hypothetical protein
MHLSTKGNIVMNNEQRERHEMVLSTTHPSGAEDWSCPVCGYRFLMQWPPNFKKVILEEGDDSAIHSGGKGGVSIGMKITQDPEEESLPSETPEAEEDGLLSMVDQELLTPWQRWMDKVNFDNLWQDGLAE